MRDLHVVRPAFYWVDLLGTALTGWTAFALAVILQPLSPEMIARVRCCCDPALQRSWFHS